MKPAVVLALLSLLLAFPLTASDLILIDSNLPDAGRLVQEADADLAYFSHTDEVTDVLNHVSGRYSAVHILGHGTPGRMQLGGSLLTSDSVIEFGALRPLLAEDADVLLYGCNSGAGTNGQALVEAVARFSGADVAASSNVTGVGGDWELEVSKGPVEAKPLQPASWHHHLQIVYQVAPGGVVDINPISSILPPGTTRMDIQLTTVPGTVHGSLFRFANFTYEPWGQGQPNPFTVFGSLGTSNENRIFAGQGFHYEASASASIGSVETIPVTYTDGFSTTNSSIQIAIANVYYPVITQQPIQNPQTNPGMTAVLQVAASIPTPPTTGTLSYQWYSGIAPNASNPVGGATSSTFTWNVPGGQGLGQYLYWCRVTLAGQGFTASSTGTITVTNQTASVSTMNAQGSNPTNGNFVTYTLEFAATGPAVGGLSASNFNVTRTGTLVSATVSNVVSGLGGQSVYPTWFITVSVGAGDGTVRLELVNASGATIGISGLPSNGQVVTFDRTRPVVSSIQRQSTNPTGAGSVSYLVGFSETVSGIAFGNFSLTLSGVTGATVGTPSSSSGSSVTVSVNTGSGSGTLRLNLNQSLSGITDAAGNQLNVAFTTGEVYNIDKTVPVVTSVVRASTNPTNASSVDFTVTFSEVVTGVASGNFSVTASGVTGASVTGVSGSGATRTVTINTGTGEGTLRLDLSSLTPAIQDVALNNVAATFNSGDSYTFDNVGPSVVSITRVSTSPTSAQSLDFLATFHEPVVGAGPANFGLVTTGSVAGATITGVSGTGATRTVTIDRGTGDGTIEVEQSSTTPAVMDTLGNAMTSTFTAGEAYTIDGTPPGIAISTPSVGTTTAGPVSFTVTYTGAANVTLASGDITLNATGNATGNISVTGTGTVTRTVEISGIAGNGTLGISIAAGTATDSVGNPALVAGPSTTFTVTNVPGVAIGAPSTTLAASGPVDFIVTYTNATTVTLTAGDVTITPTGSVTGVVSITRTGTTTRTVSVGSITGEGSFTITLVPGTSSNTGGLDIGSGPSASVSVDNTVPVLTPGSAVSVTQGSTVTAAGVGTATDNSTGVGSLVVTATNVPTGLTITAITNTAGTVTADITAAGTATVGINVVEFTVADDAGNTSTANLNVDVIANNVPTISVIADQTIAMNTDTGALAFTVGDVEDAAGTLVVTAVSNNQVLVDDGTDILLGGSGASRTITVTPQTNGVGVAQVTVTVTDSGNATATATFTVTVTDTVDAPSISLIADFTMQQDTTSSPISFTVDDPQGAATVTIIGINSSDVTLVSVPGVVVNGTPPSMQFTVTPAAGMTGTVIITLSASDGTFTASRSFTVTVLPTSNSSGKDKDEANCSSSDQSGFNLLLLLGLMAALGVAVRLRRA